MKTLVFGPRILRPYVPLRLHLSESALRMNMFCIASALSKTVQIDEFYSVKGLLTLHPYKAKKDTLILADSGRLSLIYNLLYNSSYFLAEVFQEKSAAIPLSMILFHSLLRFVYTWSAYFMISSIS
ncbi:hypothetical protein SAMN05421730_1001143 [Anaerobium acetethylicum]|uniref:Uncharacterized protein n=1 Tax=Anaerobium acetethylicum TaxID=1619234 RepID=A0A1D3TNK8_9FIRM|nr:hypothetical protein SAMN05421730_1001143 [Anaerobium acetethylicum]